MLYLAISNSQTNIDHLLKNQSKKLYITLYCKRNKKQTTNAQVKRQTLDKH